MLMAYKRKFFPNIKMERRNEITAFGLHCEMIFPELKKIEMLIYD